MDFAGSLRKVLSFFCFSFFWLNLFLGIVCCCLHVHTLSVSDRKRNLASNQEDVELQWVCNPACVRVFGF